MTEAEDIGFIQNAIRLQGVMPELKAAIERLDKALERRTLMALNQGVLTPEQALYAWQEKAILHKLLTMFDQSVRIGISKGEQHHELLNNME